ncbi:hypothetical protein T492DRAFT_941342 [Pavlovales sp. CCMP2436]|nr:hypothetical protein T492DRAFT_941342 [Pavlovales sp. CCMP2436]
MWTIVHGRQFCPPAAYAARQTRPWPVSWHRRRPVSWRPITPAPNDLRRTHTRGERWASARPHRQGRWALAAQADRLTSDKCSPLLDAGHACRGQHVRSCPLRHAATATHQKGGGCSARRLLPRAATQASFADAGLTRYGKAHGY